MGTPLSLPDQTLLRRQTRTSPIESGNTQFDVNDDVANSIAWSVMRPQGSRELRNCRVSPKSDNTIFSLRPIFFLHYTSLLVATSVLAFLLSILMSGSLPQLPFSSSIARLDPEVKALIYAVGTTVLFYITYLLIKPVRAVEFNKNKGIFWIEKQRIFRWKIGESAQMPISHIHALQVIACPADDTGQYHDEHINSNAKHKQQYEVNVVFRNTERVNVISHRHGKAIWQDAELLASYLGVPVWYKGHESATQVVFPAPD